MNELSDRQAEEDDFTVLWSKKFTEGQLREARERLPFNVVARTVEQQLAGIGMTTRGLLRYDATTGLTQTRFTLLTQSGEKGMDITISEDVSGIAGWGYYHQQTPQRRDAWIRVGNTVKRLVDYHIDNRAAEALIAEHGRDAFEDTDFEFVFDGQALGKYITSVIGYNADKFRQQVQSLVNAYKVTTATTLPQLRRRRPGRHADPENDAAYRMIQDGGGTEEAADIAYVWWCRERNITNPTQKDRDNFHVSMTRAAERAQRANLPTE